MDGVLVIDKPSGLTSHDVVAAARRLLREPRIGHTGTLDPLATGVLPLACGRATRLTRFLSASDKDYEAQIQFGLETDTYDVTGREVARGEAPAEADVVADALASFQGEYFQAPPPYSAKRVGGRRAYDLARADAAVQPPPARVGVARLELTGYADGVATVHLTCSAGFYVRSLAHDLGLKLGTVACLRALRRTRSGEFGIADAVSMDELTAHPDAVHARLKPPEALLASMPAVPLTAEGRVWATHGRELGPAQAAGPWPPDAAWVRLLGPDGALVGVATPGGSPGSLHPSVVLI